MAKDAKAGPKASPKSKGPQLPVMLAANNLLEGDVVFLTADGWTRDPAEALVAHEAEVAADLEARAGVAVKANEVVDAYLVPVEILPNGLAAARHFRELIRQRGPSVHPAYGKEAEFHNDYGR
ncbi:MULTISPECIES: DUF2849 domain-containing protein [unclassified Aureimonas]|uniref:DUF2849 domain-containing protein n=1 Tax=unclassified Aureimonas TaxID=2615206 RepID=UPI0006F8D7AB|nr:MULTISPECIES: DUF2849 domain-containing protein [unclassified Aureimonas]KQT65896.1 hypothetical protein ASG62_20415 [Aureimonas sp. Leaf427]KQT73255.1 hypothetical protein ASG54_16895 [Aureimonas sp. Leaf460]